MPDPARLALSRRRFLGRLAGLAGAPMLLTACGGGGGSDVEAPVVDAATCRGYTPESDAVRRSLGYVDRSPVPGQLCTNCRFYSVPASAGERCGGCQLIPGTSGNGPVSPGGYCRSWAVAPASS